MRRIMALGIAVVIGVGSLITLSSGCSNGQGKYQLSESSAAAFLVDSNSGKVWIVYGGKLVEIEKEKEKKFSDYP